MTFLQVPIICSHHDASGIGPPFPGSPIPSVRHSQGPTARAVFEGEGWRVESPCIKSLPQKTFYNVFRTCGRSILTPPLIIPLKLLLTSKRMTEIFCQKVTYSNLKDFKIFQGRNPQLR